MKEIVCKINKDDVFKIDSADFTIDLSLKEQYHYNFWNKNKTRMYQAGHFSKTAIDLLYISLMVYYADKKVLRKNEDDGWTREIKIYMPVFELEKWNENKILLEDMLTFLSGDRWFLNFRERDQLNSSEEKLKKGAARKKKKHLPKAICMLSGGLDSFIGAIDLLSHEKDIWFAGHYGGGKGVRVYQKKVIEKLISQYQLSENQFFNFYATPLNGIEETTRTRSFMFFAHAIILVSSSDNDTTLYIPENGFISLNIPLTNSRLGSNSTRTTHPYYMGLFQQLLINLDLRVKLSNPYQFKTKGEMILECKDPLFLQENITQTMSCSHSDFGRFLGEPMPLHCGNCLPCLIRRAAIETAYNIDKTDYRDKDFKENGAQINLRSIKLGVRDYLNNNIDAALTIQTSGPIRENIKNYCRTYIKGINELITLLNKYNG